jgi:site-specific recombinase XerD
MTDQTSAGHWIRRFLMEYAASERNLSANTCASYRDMLVLLLPYVAKRKGVAVDALSVTDLSANWCAVFSFTLSRNENAARPHGTSGSRLFTLWRDSLANTAHNISSGARRFEWCQ